jgi:hypothetical protein
VPALLGKTKFEKIEENILKDLFVFEICIYYFKQKTLKKNFLGASWYTIFWKKIKKKFDANFCDLLEARFSLNRFKIRL